MQMEQLRKDMMAAIIKSSPKVMPNASVVTLLSSASNTPTEKRKRFLLTCRIITPL